MVLYHLAILLPLVAPLAHARADVAATKSILPRAATKSDETTTNATPDDTPSSPIYTPEDCNSWVNTLISSDNDGSSGLSGKEYHTFLSSIEDPPYIAEYFESFQGFNQLPWVFRVVHKSLACHCERLGMGGECCEGNRAEIQLLGLLEDNNGDTTERGGNEEYKDLFCQQISYVLTKSVPSPAPTAGPSASPTKSPSSGPTSSPSIAPSAAPVTSSPSSGPTASPSIVPSASPVTNSPTKSPSFGPTASPSIVPSSAPVTNSPTKSPSFGPTSSPSIAPSAAPVTSSPTKSPSFGPTSSPSIVPSAAPVTGSPTKSPSFDPTSSPSVVPSAAPVTGSPTKSPSFVPTSSPSIVPSIAPSLSLIPTTPSAIGSKKIMVIEPEEEGNKGLGIGGVIGIFLAILALIIGMIASVVYRRRMNEEEQLRQITGDQAPEDDLEALMTVEELSEQAPAPQAAPEASPPGQEPEEDDESSATSVWSESREGEDTLDDLREGHGDAGFTSGSALAAMGVASTVTAKMRIGASSLD